MSNPSPPTFDRRARAQVSWTYDSTTGKVDLVATGDGLDVRITAASFPYAANLTKLLLDAPPARAFEPVADATTTVAELPTAPDGHPALADPEDTTDGLNAQTQAVVP